jgi:hypothetical protein
MQDQTPDWGIVPVYTCGPSGNSIGQTRLSIHPAGVFLFDNDLTVVY